MKGLGFSSSVFTLSFIQPLLLFFPPLDSLSSTPPPSVLCFLLLSLGYSFSTANSHSLSFLLLFLPSSPPPGLPESHPSIYLASLLSVSNFCSRFGILYFCHLRFIFCTPFHMFIIFVVFIQLCLSLIPTSLFIEPFFSPIFLSHFPFILAFHPSILPPFSFHLPLPSNIPFFLSSFPHFQAPETPLPLHLQKDPLQAVGSGTRGWGGRS